jgi:transposase
MAASTLERLFVGIDIAAKTATVAWTTTTTVSVPSITIAQTPQGFATLQQQIADLGYAPQATQVVMEATGSYWITLATRLAEAGYIVSVINPIQAHYFAKLFLKRAKTDAIDAQTLAQLAALLQPTPWTPPPAIYQELQQRLVQRDSLLELRQHIRNQRHALIQQPVIVAAVRERMDELIATIDAHIHDVEAEIASVIQHNAAWAAAAARLQTIPGIGLFTTAWLLVATLNFTLCASPEALVAYIGLAPQPRQSGTSVHRRSHIGYAGHPRLRMMLYMAALSAAQHNPLIKPFYDRLRAAGKPHKVARCAAARKLVHLAWAVVTKDREFDPTYQQRA